jgi:hypothetical protein
MDAPIARINDGESIARLGAVQPRDEDRAAPFADQLCVVAHPR